RPRRRAANGRGRRGRAHPVPVQRPRRRAAARGRALLRRRLERPALRDRRALPVERGTARGARRGTTDRRRGAAALRALAEVPGRMNVTAPADRTGPATGLVAQMLLLGLLAETAGLGPAGWLVGAACAVTMAAALARGLARGPDRELGPASWVTLTRATLAVGVA